MHNYANQSLLIQFLEKNPIEQFDGRIIQRGIMHNLCIFCTFYTFAQKFFKGWDWNFTWSLGKIMHSKSMKMVFVASIIRHKLCMIFTFFDCFVPKSFLTKNYFLIAEINWTPPGPLYTCLVFFSFQNSIYLGSFADCRMYKVRS